MWVYRYMWLCCLSVHGDAVLLCSALLCNFKQIHQKGTTLEGNKYKKKLMKMDY